MSFNLVESVKEILSSGDLLNKMAGMLGESSVSVQQAIQCIIPSVLTGVLLKAEIGDIQGTLNLATDASRMDIPFNLASLAGGAGSAKGMGFLTNLFGEKTQALVGTIAVYSGVSHQSASSLMSIATPAALNVLGKHILDTNMNASGLKSFLKSQRKKILYVMPAALFLEGIMGVENLSDLNEKIYGNKVKERPARSWSKWVLPVLLCLTAIGVIWYILNVQRPSETPLHPVMDTVVSIKNDTAAAGTVPLNTNAIKLPDGTSFIAKKGGLEEQFVNFLNDPNSKPSKRFLFNFDQLNFIKNSAVLTSESMRQVQNIATILMAYPKVKIKIGAFNDRGGDSLMSRTLSEKRAVAVAAAIKAAGANARQVSSAGSFGSDFARYPEDAADSLRVRDWYISISVRDK